ncbi:hypothetical protein QWY85_10275 [Neolewinella lacunae]|uniref:Uncharacterized protein n=1 Tax=Neolewinella lacunae TaxID=1517758 RepID=A0A923TE24_9BACT|nr:hypothetical protein [Neolewinella lacunae]MBC6995457.1 hypothetical protein [Neolewinella lacunae]MDN3635045.1 hypothetical protein [Neolewinella lacunae]
MKTPEQKEPWNPTLLIFIAVYLMAVVFLLRVAPRVAILMFLLGALGGVAWAAWEGRRRWLGARLARKEERTFAGRVSKRLRECLAQEERFRSEAESIRESTRALREDLEKSGNAGADEIARGEQLIRDFEAEFNLRHAKAAFFADCAKRLRELLDRHRLHESIAARRKELEALRSTNFDDEASLEETRYHLEQDSIQLDTIAELSRDVAISYKAEQAEELRARLEKLRTSL